MDSDPLSRLFVKTVYVKGENVVTFGSGVFHAVIKRHGRLQKYELTIDEMRAHAENVLLENDARELAKYFLQQEATPSEA